MGVTDVDDKIIKRSEEMGIDPKDLAQKYEKEFFEDLSSLHISFPSLSLRVSDHIDDVIYLIQKVSRENQNLSFSLVIGYVKPEF